MDMLVFMNFHTSCCLSLSHEVSADMVWAMECVTLKSPFIAALPNHRPLTVNIPPYPCPEGPASKVTPQSSSGEFPHKGTKQKLWSDPGGVDYLPNKHTPF